MNQVELNELFSDIPLVIPPQKPAASVPRPAERPERWIEYRVSVAFVIIDREGKPRMRTGRIASCVGSHGSGLEVDNVKRTVVWCDQVLNELADCADDAHERLFDTKDPSLLRLDELDPLKNPETAAVWFQGVYSLEVVRQISALISKPDLGREDELSEEGEKWKLAKEAARSKLGWYEGATFHPPVTAGQ